MLSLLSQAGTQPEEENGVLRLAAETKWVVEAKSGDEAKLDELARHLRADVCERVGKSALLLHFGNAVGRFDLPHLPAIEVRSRKWGQQSFDEMLSEISARVAALPFAAGTGASLPYDRSIKTDERVLYHAFVYLRHVLSDSAPREVRLEPALRLVLAEPHRKFERFNRVVPLYRAQRIGPRTMRRLVEAGSGLQTAPPGVAPALAGALGGHLPETIDETAVRSTVDVPENRFVKAFLDQAIGIVDEIRQLATEKGGAFAARVGSDCDRMLGLLVPIRRAGLWDEISEMRRLPVESTVLHRRRGYRETFHHFIRMRMAVRIPFETTDDLLEIKNIASLYELWTFFGVEKAVTSILGPPLVAGSPKTTKLQQHLPFDLRIAWKNGSELFYNLRYSRSRARWRSYSLPLRPDVVLRAASGNVAAFDAKFKLRRVEAIAPISDEVGSEETAGERRGVFQHADLYKMHTYRDALSIASVWILYPGHDFRFYEAQADGRIVKEHTDLEEPLDGVGAIPMRPGEDSSELRHVMRLLLAGSAA